MIKIYKFEYYLKKAKKRVQSANIYILQMLKIP